MKDGIYFDIITIKDGVEYKGNRISILDATEILTNSLMDGMSRILGISEKDIEEYRKNHDS